MAIVHVKNTDSIKFMYGLDNGYSIIRKCITFFQIKNLIKSYDGSFKAVDDISFSILN